MSFLAKDLNVGDLILIKTSFIELSSKGRVGLVIGKTPFTVKVKWSDNNTIILYPYDAMFTNSNTITYTRYKK